MTKIESTDKLNQIIHHLTDLKCYIECNDWTQEGESKRVENSDCTKAFSNYKMAVVLNYKMEMRQLSLYESQIYVQNIRLRFQVFRPKYRLAVGINFV